MIYFLSDTHFYHTAILGYCSRPFSSIEEMDETLIANWNNTIFDNDTVYFLGDLALNSTKDQVKTLVSNLKGNKILLRGNHDSYSNNFYLEAGFSEVHKFLILSYKDIDFVLTHIPEHLNWHTKNNKWEPFKVDKNRIKVNIHGHLHNTISEHLPPWAYCCVSVEQINYKPIDIGKIYNKVKIFSEVYKYE